jgi:hypothetical protein
MAVCSQISIIWVDYDLKRNENKPIDLLVINMGLDASLQSLLSQQWSWKELPID